MTTKPTLHPLRGLAHVAFWADDVAAARDWYTELLGLPAYFQRPDSNNPAYVEFRLGDHQHELGIVDRRYAPATAVNDRAVGAPSGAVASWHVDDLPGMFERLLAMGAREYEPITPREAGFATASVSDPFGNILGLIHSPHYLEMLAGAGRRTASDSG